MNRATTDDGAELAWWSTGRGKPLLLIAGQAVTHQAWDPVLDRLLRHHRVPTYDHRGIGMSTLGDPPAITTRTLARDAVAVLHAAGVGRAHVFGHSLGGRVAQWIAIDHPDRIGALVLGATTAGDKHGPARTPEVTTALLSGDPHQLAPLFFAPDVGAETEHSNAVFTAGGDRPTLALYYWASRAHDALHDLSHIRAPTLVQHGADDAVTPPEHAHRLAGGIPKAHLQVLPGLRHGYYLQSPAALTHVARHLIDHGELAG